MLPRAHTPLWALALTAVLVTAGLAKRNADLGMPAAREAGDRRASDSEAKAPERGWWDALKRVCERISEDRVTSIAGGVTFFVLLAIFPAIAALVSIYGLFADPSMLDQQLDALKSVLPGGAIEVIGEQMRRLVAEHNTTLGATFIIGLAVSLWSANAGMKALIDALNIVFDETETRSFVRLNALSLLITFGAIVFIVLAVAGVVALPVAFGYVGLAGETELLLRVGRWPALLAFLALGLAVIYRFGPDRKQAKWRWITWGSIAAAMLWLIASMLFSWYAENFASYNKTYGALGAAIGFMTWIWISAIVILAGAELDAELECQDPTMRKRAGCGFAPGK